MAGLEVDALTFGYEGLPMAFSLAVEAGECLAVIGPSGAGKSTLLALIGGFETPTGGCVRVDGRDVTGLKPAERPMTTLFQDHNLFAHLDVAANVGLGLHPGLRLTGHDRAKVAAVLNEVGLAGLERRRPAELSGGQRQRAALARALVRHRPVLLLDEPFTALGPALRREMLDLVTRLRRRLRLTVVLVTHDPEEARTAARRTAFLHDGRVAAVGETAALLDDPPLPVLRHYLGNPQP